MWFLEWVTEDVGMTQAGYLPTAMVRSGAEGFGWDKGWIEDAPQKESDSRELMSLHELLADARAIRHRKGSIKMTEKGRRMTERPGIRLADRCSITHFSWMDHRRCRDTHPSHGRRGDG